MAEFRYTEWSGVLKSDLVYFVAYNEHTRELAVGLKPKSGDNHVYMYSDVPREDYVSFLRSDSKGKYFNKVIKPDFGPAKADAPAYQLSLPYDSFPGRPEQTNLRDKPSKVISKATVPPKGGNSKVRHDVTYKVNGNEKNYTVYRNDENAGSARQEFESLASALEVPVKVVKVTVHVD